MRQRFADRNVRRSGIFARIHVGAAGEKVPAQAARCSPPRNHVLLGVRGFFTRLVVASEIRLQSCLGIAHAARETALSRAKFGEDQAADGSLVRSSAKPA